MYNVWVYKFHRTHFCAHQYSANCARDASINTRQSSYKVPAFNQKLDMTTNFIEKCQNGISWNSLEMLSSCCMRTQADVVKLMGTILQLQVLEPSWYYLSFESFEVEKPLVLVGGPSTQSHSKSLHHTAHRWQTAAAASTLHSNYRNTNNAF